MTPWTVAPQGPLSMGFSRQEYWSGLPFSFPGYLPDPGIKPTSPTLAGRFFTIELPGKLLPLTPTPLSQGYWPAVYSVEAEIETTASSLPLLRGRPSGQLTPPSPSCLPERPMASIFPLEPLNRPFSCILCGLSTKNTVHLH